MLSIQEICQLTGKSEKTIYRLMNSGKLPYETIGNKRYSKHEDIASNFKVNTKNSVDMELSKKVDILTAEITRLSTLVESLITPPLQTNQNRQRLKNEPHDNQRLSQDSQRPSKNSVNTSKEITRKPPSSSNEIRAEKSKMQLFEALDKLKKSQSIPVYRGKPSITGIYKITGIDRGTISKYIEEWISKNPS